MREESHIVKTAAAMLPDTPYDLWVRGELHDHLGLDDDQRVEIIGGEIVVSPSPRLRHNRVVKSVQRAFNNAHHADSEFPWEVVDTTNLVVAAKDGYIPDTMIVHTDILQALEEDDDWRLHPDHVEMILEVTSKSNASSDREPTAKRALTKWTGYARYEVPYYLLVDRSPKDPRIVLYSIPDPAVGAYLHKDTWKFGETVSLEHFGVEIDTSKWKPWTD